MAVKKTKITLNQSSQEEPIHQQDENAALQEELKKVQVKLARKNRFVENLLFTLPNPAYVYDIPQKRITFVNHVSAPFLGYPSDSIAAMDHTELEKLIHPDDVEHVRAHYETYEQLTEGSVFELEFRFKHSFGDWHWISIRETPYEHDPEGRILQMLGTAEDVTERRLVQERLWYSSTHDSLTDLYNRPYFEGEISRLERGRHFPMTVMAADIDGLIEINDKLGTAAGDLIICNAGEIIRACFRVEDVVARTGGDEFGVLLPDIGVVSVDAIRARVERKIETYNNSHPENRLSITLGFATADRGEDLRDTAQEAERNVITSKRKKRKMKS